MQEDGDREKARVGWGRRTQEVDLTAASQPFAGAVVIRRITLYYTLTTIPVPSSLIVYLIRHLLY